MGRIRKGRVVETALCKKGFYQEIDGNHVCYFLIDSDVKTKMSHGMMGSDMGPELLGLMARQLHLTKKQFLNLIDCTLDENAYRAILREQSTAETPPKLE